MLDSNHICIVFCSFKFIYIFSVYSLKRRVLENILVVCSLSSVSQSECMLLSFVVLPLARALYV